MKRLDSQMEHDRAVLADGLEHHRLLGLGDDLAHDMDRLALEVLEMRQRHITTIEARPSRATRRWEAGPKA